MSLPRVFQTVPASLSVMGPVPTSLELAEATNVRRSFLLAGEPEPYMVDIVRAFRALRGTKCYLEVGTRDKGNLAYASSLLSDDATIGDIDIDPPKGQAEKLRSTMRPAQGLISFVGDSVGSDAVKWLSSHFPDCQLDAVFLDSSHMFSHIMREIEIYMPRLASNGLLLIHDIYWEGNKLAKGKAQALRELDRLVPVYCVFQNEPIHRFCARPDNVDIWGGVGVVRKADYDRVLLRGSEI